MSIRATIGMALGLVLICAPVHAQPRDTELARQIALFTKGRPANMSPDDWGFERIGLFARIKDLALDRGAAGARAAIPLLVATLNDPNAEVAVMAAGTLIVVDPVNSRARALAGLAAGLKSESDQAQQWALNDLGAQGVFGDLPLDAETVLTDFLRTDPGPNRHKAVRALRNVPARRMAAMAAVIVPLLADPDRAVRFAAVESLEAFGPRAAAAVPALRRLRTTRDTDLQKAIDDAISSIESTPAERAAVVSAMVVPSPAPFTASSVQAVERQLRSRDVDIRLNALRDIDSRRASAGALVPVLTTLLKDPEPSVRYVAAYVLTSVDRTRAAAALPLLTELLRSSTGLKGGWISTGIASSGLGRLGRPGADALVGALAAASPQVRIAALEGLMTSDVFPPAAVPALVRLTRDPEEATRQLALMTLRIRRPPASQVLSALVARLNDSSANVRVYALIGLMQLGADAKPAIAAVRKLTTGSDTDLTFFATAAAVVIEGGGRELIPMLVGRFASASAIGGDDPEAELDMMVSSQALARYGADARAALPALNFAFDGETGFVRGYVGVAIAAIDPGSRARVVSALTETLGDADDFSKGELRRALATIRQP